jgi:DNA-binding transcriptional ArsR family regulator
VTARRPDAFDAIADSTRRGIITRLRDDAPLTAGSIADAFPAISRPAVSKHLRILRESGLVSAEQQGREWLYRLEVAALARMQRDWFEQFAPLIEASLEKLKEQVEGAPHGRSKQPRR